jgi:hypothetical protein
MKAILIALVLLVLPSLAQAQTPTVVTPASALIFQSSPDHSATDAVSGQAIVTSYQADAVVSTGPTGALGWTQGLGKPTPDTSGAIAINGAAFTPLYNAMALGVVYTLKVSAVGPGGAAASAASNPFGRANLRAPGAPGTPTMR